MLQGFVRSTTKYWVRTTDVSTVKHHILQHLPVFQYDAGDENQQDAQLINSVYFDNSSMELYHGRLDKRPNAIALRIRYFSGVATHSFVGVVGPALQSPACYLAGGMEMVSRRRASWSARLTARAGRARSPSRSASCSRRTRSCRS